MQSTAIAHACVINVLSYFGSYSTHLRQMIIVCFIIPQDELYHRKLDI